VQLSAQAHKLEREIGHVMAFIRGGDTSPRVREDLARLEEQMKLLQAEDEHLDKTPSNAIAIPSVAEIRALSHAAVSDLAKDSPEFGKLMKLIIPKIVVFPYRSCRGGHVVLRGNFRLRLSNLYSDKRIQETLQLPLERILTVDLFNPRQLEACRRRILELRAGGMSEKQASKACGIAIAAAQKAAGLQRQMDSLGLTDPYVSVQEPPDDYGKFRRHLHMRYRFEPLEGAGEI
jgi:hypothetical protein